VGSFFQVDLDVLQRMIKTLGDAGDQMDTALKSMSSSQAGQIGTDAFNHAADDFQHTWQYGLGQLTQMIKETNEGVSKAHDAYKQTEDGVTQAMQKINGQAMGQIDQIVAAATPRGAR
jgi:methyl-accepting chemotaxis protein